jgi:hypothetical protein
MEEHNLVNRVTKLEIEFSTKSGIDEERHKANIVRLAGIEGNGNIISGKLDTLLMRNTRNEGATTVWTKIWAGLGTLALAVVSGHWFWPK